jgi:hypothetical protein
MSIIEMKAVLAYVGLGYFNHLPFDMSVLSNRIIISNFSFEPAYDGQVAKPTAAVTMSTPLSQKQLFHSICSSEPEDGLPLRVKIVSRRAH